MATVSVLVEKIKQWEVRKKLIYRKRQRQEGLARLSP